ncbi:MAG: hypothetical protein HZY76_10920 [Anaerolineae bacterium]|nr:MAG: hypothetical protein HZY76_10920 [Anaerolineae bacterium]
MSTEAARDFPTVTLLHQAQLHGQVVGRQLRPVTAQLGGRGRGQLEFP